MFKSRSSPEKGSVFIELVLILPVLILLVAGIIQFGFLLNAKIVVNSASYEGARAATLSDNPELEAANAVLGYASSTMPGWDFGKRLSMNMDISGTDPGDMIKVEVIYKIPIIFSDISPFNVIGDNYAKVIGSSVMRVEEKE
ncbi:MAG: TadE/TadG family type IV pilus assembly protein [Actinomycetota bacterium]|nr:TadE/TadG family type IV pilus assembly protein [Actinomycetota bacterium]